jgi:hypothetical protein
MKRWFGYLMLLTLLLLAALSGSPRQDPPAPAIAPTPAVQAKRSRLLDDLIKDHIFYKAEMNERIVSLWVMPKFYLLTFDDKRRFVEVAYAYFFESTSTDNFLFIKDVHSGKRIGSFETTFGLTFK